jgi:uroporphyrinogen decarboxylase
MIKEPDDLEKLKYLFPDLSSSNFTEYHKAVEEMGDDGLILMNISGPLDYLAGEVYSLEQMMIDYHINPELFHGVIRLFSDYVIRMVELAVADGITDFFLNYFYESFSTGWSPTIFNEAFMPTLKRQVDIIHASGGLVDYYDDGKLMEAIPFLVDAGVDVIETCSPSPVGDFDLKRAKAEWGNAVTFKGLVDMINVVWRGTPADIDNHVREIIDANNGKEGMILGTMDNFRPETSDENLEAYFNAANKYR